MALAALFSSNEAWVTWGKHKQKTWDIKLENTPKNDLPMPQYNTLAINRSSFNTWFFCLGSSVLSCRVGLFNGSYHHISVFALLYIACTRVYCFKKISNRKKKQKVRQGCTHSTFFSGVSNARNDGRTPFSNAMSISSSISAYLYTKERNLVPEQHLPLSSSAPSHSLAPWHAGVPVEKD